MSAQSSLFDVSNLASTVEIPQAPALVPHTWPFPGLSPEDSARACIAFSPEYFDMLAAVIKTQGGAKIIGKQVLSLIPNDWRKLAGNYAHGSIDFRDAEQRGIKVDYVPHDDGGFHFTYQAIDPELHLLQRKAA